MKNYKIYCFVLISLSSCKYVEMAKMSNNQNIDIKSNVTDTFNLIDEKIYLDCYINNSIKTFILDTGAPSATFNYDGKINKKVTVGELESPTGAKMDNNLIAVDTFYTKSIFIQNPVFRNVIKDNEKCKINSDGILGVEFLCNGRLFINFDEKTIEYLDDKSFNLLLKDYKEIKNVEYDDVNYNFIFPIVINKQVIKLKLDTGYNGSLMLTENDYCKNFSRENEKMKIGLVVKSLSKHNLDTLKFYDTNIKVMDEEIEKVRIATILKIKRNLAGIMFLKRYNWILDYENKKLYVKKNKFIPLENNVDKMCKSNIISNKIILTSHDIKATKYKLGSTVISVNNQKVTPENICEIQDLLNNTEDWNTLKLETIPVK